MSSLQQIFQELEAKLANLDLLDGFSVFLEKSEQTIGSFMKQYTAARLEQIDDYLVKEPSARKKHTIHKRDVQRTLLTQYGPIIFKRSYFKSKKETYSYLLDRLVGIDRYERIERGLCAKLTQAATEMSYAKAGEKVSKGQVGKQSVMRLVQRAEVRELEYPEEKVRIPAIHLECDEDHVNLQTGKGSIVKLCVIHGPKVIQNNRSYLPNRFSLVSSGDESNEDFWYRILDELRSRYEMGKDIPIYIHGDGANWIKAGLGVIPGSRYILDKFHVLKALRTLIGGEERYLTMMKQFLYEDNIELLKMMVDVCVDSECCTKKDADTFLSYYSNNYEGISIWNELDWETAGSCAEGLVSHLLSERLSGRPKAWLPKGLEAVSRLRTLVSNGGMIVADDFRKKQPTQPFDLRKKDKTKLAQKRNDYLPSPTSILQNCQHQSAQWRLFDKIKYSGYSF